MKNNKKILKSAALAGLVIITVNSLVKAGGPSNYDVGPKPVSLLNIEVGSYFHNKVYTNDSVNAVLIESKADREHIISSAILSKNGVGVIKLPNTLPEEDLSEVFSGFLRQLGCHIKTYAISDKTLKTSNMLSFYVVSDANYRERSPLANSKDIIGLDLNGYAIESEYTNDILIFSNRDSKVDITATCDALNVHVDLKLRQGWNILALKDNTSPNYSDGWAFTSILSNSEVLSIKFLEITSNEKLK
ncbi:hypothetical protein MF271_22290 (plasmid) [Deinococcus sp. KNUC1210]|uniref:hypothetical protein n=1 Tax=Deinococcus sp. KNUC1210 TaxID=2917691 RepID=UPI001EF06D27|nr:hypothetical protein [Deinococcus sp. KNUC1210]ULH18202.1 hypothetical protein MF271_22290 [Deinococcus sp. KNUC1210]